jgi:hypothetical protein
MVAGEVGHRPGRQRDADPQRDIRNSHQSRDHPPPRSGQLAGREQQQDQEQPDGTPIHNQLETHALGTASGEPLRSA